MRLKAGKTTQKGTTLALALVDRIVIEDKETAISIVKHIQEVFPGMHVVLVYDEPGKEALYFGRPDIVQKLKGLAMVSIAWEEFDVPES